MADKIFDIISTIWFWIKDNTFYINIILGITIVFFQRRDPTSVWAWLLLLYFIPILGFFLYLVIGHDYRKTKMFRTKEIEDELNAAIKTQEDIIRKKRIELDEEHREYSDLVLYNLEANGAIYTKNNNVEIFTDGNEKFNDLITEMEKARKFIHIQYYIMSKGELLDRILNVLEQKAKEGVEVRVLYDGMGGRFISKKNIKRMKNAGIKVGVFFPPILGKLNLRFNYRNHRKIVVIDGKTGYVGGFNVGEEYLGRKKKFGYWRDTHLKINGDAVTDLQIRFVLDWNYATKENLFKEEKYFEKYTHKNPGSAGIQIISSGPDSKRQEIRDNYLRLINKAKKSIYIQTPYFIPDEAVLQALNIAAMSGIDVKLMIPCKPDHPFVYWVTYSYSGDLLESGARIYCYDNGFLHAKGMVVDGIVSCYGTANMDMRSFALNFEVNAVLYDRQLSERLEKAFLKDLECCSELTKYSYERRSLPIRIKEQISRLLAPLM